MNMLSNRLKKTYKLSKDELSLLMYFIQTKGHSLRVYDITHHSSIHFKELDEKNMHEILLGLVNKKTISCNNEIYILTNELFEIIKNVNISYIDVAINFRLYKGAKNAMPSLNSIFENNKNTIYVFLAITPHDIFYELKNRIKRQRKTIFFMPTENCFRNKNEKNKHRIVLKKWIEFIKNNKNESEFIEFYLVSNYVSNKNNDCYRFLYSSLLAKDTVRFNIYKYEGDGSVVTGIGDLIECQGNENSLYDIVERGYTDVWNDRIGVRQINKYIWIKRFIANHLYWILFLVVMLVSTIIFFKILLLPLEVFMIIMSGLGFILSLLKRKITKFFHKKKLPF